MAPLKQLKNGNYRQTVMSDTYKNGFRVLNMQPTELLKIFLDKMHKVSSMLHWE
jgi:hypothetical protein